MARGVLCRGGMDTLRYEVVPAQVWVRDDGKRASLHGAVPWTSCVERERWHVERVGYTVYDRKRGTYGIGRAPWKTEAEAREWVQAHE